MTRQEVRRSAFVLSVLHNSLNAALYDFKKKMCQNNPNTNYNKTLNIALIPY